MNNFYKGYIVAFFVKNNLVIAICVICDKFTQRYDLTENGWSVAYGTMRMMWRLTTNI